MFLLIFTEFYRQLPKIFEIMFQPLVTQAQVRLYPSNEIFLLSPCNILRKDESSEIPFDKICRRHWIICVTEVTCRECSMHMLNVL
jgi:hypothetical protein